MKPSLHIVMLYDNYTKDKHWYIYFSIVLLKYPVFSTQNNTTSLVYLLSNNGISQ